MVKKIIFGVVAVIVLVVAVVFVAAAMQPDEYTVKRTAKIKAPPATVFAQVNDFHKWQAWSPWAELDPAMKQTYEGPTAGTGAKYGWSGNDKAGEGKMEIVDEKPGEQIGIRLEFIKPMVAVCRTEFTFKPEGDETLATWTMSGKYDGLFHKAICMLMNMDKMVGKDFDKGFAKMKEVAEKEAVSPAPPADPPAVPATGDVSPPVVNPTPSSEK